MRRESRTQVGHFAPKSKGLCCETEPLRPDSLLYVLTLDDLHIRLKLDVEIAGIDLNVFLETRQTHCR